ncbi:MAG: SMP-30/gluconolactonase/LRE family protein [Nocardioides sp.]|uniref:SMP-30/gluconolactonase/LRE family protein n=1 Tax=Nocardioides sp. TaxID=35761 RepID=UPI0039E65CC7
MSVSFEAERLADLVDPELVVEALADGFSLTEGPVWHPSGFLLFSEIPSSSRMKWSGSGGLETVEHPTNRGNGMALAPDGTLVVCEHETSCMVRLTLAEDGSTVTRAVLASHYGDDELNSPNDVVVRSDGTVFFTDPTYGRIHGWVGKVREPELSVRAVYSISEDGDLRQLASDFNQPNGLCLSPDESLLYVNDSAEYHIRRFVIEADGTLSGGEVLIAGLGDPDETERGFCDGMKCDSSGNIWVTGPDGVWVVDSVGTLLGTVGTPEQVHNLTWGGEEFNQMYLMGSSAIYRFETKTTGAHRARSI